MAMLELQATVYKQQQGVALARPAGLIISFSRVLRGRRYVTAGRQVRSVGTVRIAGMNHISCGG